MAIVDFLSYIATSFAIYFFFRLLWVLFDYVVFKIVINEASSLIDKAADKWKKPKNPSTKEDELSKNKTKEQKKLVEVERRMANGEEVDIDEPTYAKSQEKIVGVSVDKKLLDLRGFVYKLFGQRYDVLKSLDPRMLQEKGFWQAMEMTKQGKTREMGQDQGSGRARG